MEGKEKRACKSFYFPQNYSSMILYKSYVSTKAVWKFGETVANYERDMHMIAKTLVPSSVTNKHWRQLIC